MLYVLYGLDALAIRRRLAAIRAEADGGSGMLESNLSVFEGREATSEAILAAAMAMPFLAPRRLVIAEGLLERFGSGTEQRGARALDALAPLLNALEGNLLPPTTDLVVVAGAVTGRNPLLDRLKKVSGGAIEEFRPPQRDELFRFIRDEGQARGIRWKSGPSQRPMDADEAWRRPAERDPVRLIAGRFEGDTLSIANELDKLALYAMGRETTVDDVDVICGGERESTVFQMIDAMMDGNVEAALRALEFLRRKGEGSQGILALTANGYRRLATILDLIDDGATPEAIGKAINLPWESLRDAAIARAKRLGQAGVVAAFEAIVDTDRRTKAGELDEDIGVELLLLTLASLSPAPQRRAR